MMATEKIKTVALLIVGACLGAVGYAFFVSSERPAMAQVAKTKPAPTLQP
jgi:hypothetical protein